MVRQKLLYDTRAHLAMDTIVLVTGNVIMPNVHNQ